MSLERRFVTFLRAFTAAMPVCSAAAGVLRLRRISVTSIVPFIVSKLACEPACTVIPGLAFTFVVYIE